MLAYFFTSGEQGDIYRIEGMRRKLFKLDLPMIDKQLLPYRSIGGKMFSLKAQKLIKTKNRLLKFGCFLNR